MAMPKIVHLVHPKRTIRCRAGLLRAISPVLDGHIRDGSADDDKCKLHISDVSLVGLKAFIRLANALARAKTSHALLSINRKEVASIAQKAMPLIHKYDCQDLLSNVQAAVLEHPTRERLMALLRYDMDAAFFSSLPKKTQHELAACSRQDLEGLPQPVLIHMLLLLQRKVASHDVIAYTDLEEDEMDDEEDDEELGGLFSRNRGSPAWESDSESVGWE